MWRSDLIKYLRTKKKVIVTLIAGIATAADIMSFAPFPAWVLLPVRVLGLVAVLFTLIYLIYGFGAFQHLSGDNESRTEDLQREVAKLKSALDNRTCEIDALKTAIASCTRYLRFEPHGDLYDKDLVNLLARSAWLRNNQRVWKIARVDADNAHIFIAEGSALIIPGLVFSVTRTSTGDSCRYQVKPEDVTHDETCLKPTGFQIRAVDKPKDFSIDVPDPTPEELGREDFKKERFIAAIFGALNEK